MGETKSNTVLGRIAAAGREDHQARAMTLQKAMRVTLTKVADSLMDLPLAVIGSVVQKVTGDGLESVIDDDALLLLLDGPTARVGAVQFDPVLVGGMIQQQTIGTVRPDTGAARPMTRTDAAICAPLLDAVFERVPKIVDSAEDARLVDGFRFGAKAEHSRALRIALEAPEYTILRLTIDLARGTRQGEMVIILPIQHLEVTVPEGPDDHGEHKLQPPEMSKVVMDLTTELNMILCRVKLPLTKVRDLKPGDVLDIPPGHFPNVQICEKFGRVLGQGVVGHVDGLRAVKPKQKPLHASQPLRRASDEDRVDMPKVEEIGDRRRAQDTDARVSQSNEKSEDAGAAQQTTTLGKPSDADGANDSEHKVPAIADAPEVDLPALEDFPDLEDLPDLADMPDLADLSETKLPIAS
ncbi:FliM/FliN family flagellar motor C-terminal domain-containing protein [Tateyamaria pelophila]|uniref:FliM/FliN family flagellar motor C-terminal domain-containing protein n=1 Tax=Tateyamaria pelophila TaxID=328415 RepID=UPI001CBD6EDD|nr:FliM/FliN family flagellar motor C-terminal domain-containing protein [Tateyamaria pelophila]